VLPFEDRGGFDTEAYYPDSLSEDLLNRLSGIDQLSVVSRRSSFKFRNPEVEQLGLVEIASRLGVGNVLSGYIRREGASIRLSLELVDVSSGRELVRWSNSYDDRPIGEMLAIQTEVTRAIANRLLPDGLSAQMEQRLVRQSTRSIQAYESYLQAKEILREPLAEFASLILASDLFSKAISLDGGFAWAKAGLCASDTLAYRVGGSFDAMTKSCSRLIGIDTDLYDVRLALGDFYLNTGNLKDAEIELNVAVKLNQKSAEAKISLAELYAERFYQSQKELDRIRAEEAYLEAIAAEPDYWFVYHAYANYLTRQNRFKDAMVQMKKPLPSSPRVFPR
jgi:TolB-like protein